MRVSAEAETMIALLGDGAHYEARSRALSQLAGWVEHSEPIFRSAGESEWVSQKAQPILLAGNNAWRPELF